MTKKKSVPKKAARKKVPKNAAKKHKKTKKVKTYKKTKTPKTLLGKSVYERKLHPNAPAKFRDLKLSIIELKYLGFFERKGCSYPKACRAMKISRSEPAFWERENMDFKRAIYILRESLLDYTEDQLMKKVKEGHVTAMIFWLKCQGKHRGWIERYEVDVQRTVDEVKKLATTIGELVQEYIPDVRTRKKFAKSITDSLQRLGD